MADKRHWLATVEDVLKAETGDLRRLAKIAGEDPKTMYIGTSLNGTDLRGQDLRGMALPGLKLAKVKHDSATLVGQLSRVSSPHIPKFESSARTLVYFPNRYDARWLARLQGALDLVSVFRPGERDSFQDELKASGGSSAAFVVLDYSRSRGLEHALTNFGPDVTTLVTIRGNYPLVGTGDYQVGRWVDGPVVLLPAGKAMFPGATVPPIASTIQFISMVSSNWLELRRLLTSIPLAVFMWESARKGGRGTSWARLLGRMHRESLSDRRMYRLAAHQAASAADEEMAYILLPDARKLHLGMTRYLNKSAAVGVLVDVGKPKRRKNELYEESVTTLLSRRGWSHLHDQDGNWAIEGPHRRWSVRIEGNMSEFRSVDWRSDLLFKGMPDVGELVVTEDASVQNVVSQLLLYQRLPVSVADLSLFDANVGSFWFLIGLQLERIKGSSDFSARTVYLRMILISTEMWTAESHVDLRQMLDTAGYVLFCAKYERDGSIFRFDVECRYNYNASSDQPPLADMTFHVEINPGGPILTAKAESLVSKRTAQNPASPPA